MSRPALENWRRWRWAEYLQFFLSPSAVRARLRGEPSVLARLGVSQLIDFCQPIAERLRAVFHHTEPTVSVLVPAYNEELEILPTLVSYTLLDTAGIPVELVIADNNSSDNTRAILDACRVHYHVEREPGVAYARNAAYKHSDPRSKYLWLTDADTRVVPPLRDPIRPPTARIITASAAFLEKRSDVIALSTGAVCEGAHWIYHTIHRIALMVKQTKKYSCWSGCNQFIRRFALEKIGGIDLDVDYRDDHHRAYQIARLAKQLGMNMLNANTTPELAIPVYYSGRRYATFGLVARHIYKTLRAKRSLERDKYGFPIHPKHTQWELIRR